jgi:hypothetical protein
MKQPTSLVILFFPTLLGSLQLPYPKQLLKLQNHPLGWICTVHITVATFQNHTSSDIAERFLKSNREMIIPTVSTMLNRSISIAPIISFFEPCTISILVDSVVNGFSYANSELGIPIYIPANEYTYRGWRHSAVIVLWFSCRMRTYFMSDMLPHRLFYHSFICGSENSFPNYAFFSKPLRQFYEISEATHNIHDRQLPIALRRSIPKLEYGWDDFDPNKTLGFCFASRWQMLSDSKFCRIKQFAVQHFQNFINFTPVAINLHGLGYGQIITRSNFYGIENPITVHTVDSISNRIIYCDHNVDSLRLRPVNLLSPFSSWTWGLVISLLIFCSMTMGILRFDFNSRKKNVAVCIETILTGIFELTACLLGKEVGKENATKVMIGLLVICLGSIYQNHLTIDLVFPRAQNAIRNVTELLDLNFYVIESSPSEIVQNKSNWLKTIHFDTEIDRGKREKYVRDADRWFRFGTDNPKLLLTNLSKGSDKIAFSLLASYRSQLLYLRDLTERNYPFSCHFVKQPFAPLFEDMYFFNPKAEDFKLLTAKFLDHGLFEFWKRLESHLISLLLSRRSIHRLETFNSSSASASQDYHVSNNVGQVHLYGFYMLVSIFTVVSVVIFVLECVKQQVIQLSLPVLAKFKHISLEFSWTIVRFLFLMSRLISSLYRNPTSL